MKNNEIDKKFIMLARYYLLADIFDVYDRDTFNPHSPDLKLQVPIYDEDFLSNLEVVTNGDIDGYINRLAYKFSNDISETELLYIRLGIKISKECNIKVLNNKNHISIKKFKQGLNCLYTDLGDVNDDDVDVYKELIKYMRF